MTYQFKDGTMIIPGIDIYREDTMIGSIYADGYFYASYIDNSIELTTTDLAMILMAYNSIKDA